jgi:outer membrane immunogenic protein
MRHLLLSTVAFAALAGSAFAADLPSRKEAPVYVAPIPVFSWTGFYVGGDVGGSFGSSSIHSDWTGLHSRSLETSGFMGGGYVGYNYQWNQSVVLGVEGDFQGTSAEKSVSWVGSNIVGDPNVYTAKFQTNWLASINGRLGIAYDRAMFYAIGGAAWAQTSASLSAAAPSGLFIGSVSRDKDLTGWDIGGGVEYAFTPNWVGRVEYRYYDFSRYDLTPTWSANLTSLHQQTSLNTVRVGLAYLFSAPAPVVAKY